LRHLVTSRGVEVGESEESKDMARGNKLTAILR